ncbi:uncharacterized protein LOC131226301 [Magnolia sinica]|uniref:uncharacterized protein LOC131226301 n=1 Tax=Magnolia sinica TaxID=86752 RepID=UPI00265B7102|nr:uncharacterized protein LOC131226301 [Magnolia sinica]
MNSRPNSSQTPSSFNNYQFDFGLTSNRSSSTVRPLKDQKNPPLNTPHSFSTSSSSSRPVSSSSSSSSWAPNKPAWTHQPSPAHQPKPTLSNPTSMVGDIFGKSWASTGPSGSVTHLGIPAKNPNLFGDLVGTALGQGKAAVNAPLKDAGPPRNSYSMGNLADTLPKSNDPNKNSGWGSSENLGNYSSVSNDKRSGNFAGPAMKSGGSTNSSKDPFESLADLGSKKSQPMMGNSSLSRNSSGDEYFSAFQNAPKTTNSIPTPPMNNTNVSNSGSFPKMDDFGMPKTQDKQPVAPQSKGIDPLDMLFSSSASASASTAAAEGSGNQPFSEVDDWGLDSEFGGNDAGGTIELEGLPPPPAGVTASIAKNKGLDNHKQGQYADAIKWLSWAIALLEKAGDESAAVEVLSCRASCYKEVGEYKKAVSDCSKILENDSANVSVLLQRALLYESSEKYKLGAEDLRAVLKIDPSNRLAKSTIHRLAKMAD